MPKIAASVTSVKFPRRRCAPVYRVRNGSAYGLISSNGQSDVLDHASRPHADRHGGLSLRVMGTEAIGTVLDNGQLIT